VQQGHDVIRTPDAYPIAGAGIELIAQDAVLLAAAPLRVRRIVVRLANAAVVFHSANQRVRSASCARDDLLAYVVFGERVCGTVNGLAVRPGLMLAVDAIKRAGSTDKAKVRDALEATKGFVATSGTFNMSPTDHMGLDLSAFRLLEVKGGDWSIVQ
jgi:hypothetical protein